MEIYREMKEILFSKGIDVSRLGEEFYDEDIFDLLSSDSIVNIKGENFYDRFRDVLSDPNNLFIPRCDESGEYKDGIVTLHNGIKIYDQCYYNTFSDIFILNKGVHEPAEERMFAKVLKFIDKGGVMVEHGAYWAFYSMWFARDIEDAVCYCIEPVYDNLMVGKRNFELNGLKANFSQGAVGHGKKHFNEFLMVNEIEKIDLLHFDIQGHELEMLQEAEDLLSKKLIKYIFISTHNNEVHNSCNTFLKNFGYRIICESDFDDQTFSWDGLIVACPEEINEIPYTNIGNRSKTRLISELYFSELFNKIR